MIKPILYYDILEKNKIEAELMVGISQEERLVMSNALLDLFFKIPIVSDTEDFVTCRVTKLDRKARSARSNQETTPNTWFK